MHSNASDGDTVSSLTLACAPPFDWAALADFYRARAIAGVEEVDGLVYRRIARAGGRPVLLELAPHGDVALHLRVSGAPLAAIAGLVQSLTRALDLDTDTAPARRHLARDALLGPMVAARPGLRVAACPDPFEQAVRAILGQQVSLGAARDLAARLCRRWGEPVHFAAAPTLDRAFPRPATLVTAEVATLGMPGARGRTVSDLAAAVLAQPDLLAPGQALDDALARLQAIRGIGPWSAHYIALRALRQPDAFPASDVGILRALTGRDGQRPTARAATARAETWRPWRGYAAQYLWQRDAMASMIEGDG